MAHTWRQWLQKLVAGGNKRKSAGRRLARPFLETLEDRTLPSAFPFVQSIARTDPNPTNASTVHFTVAFSEAVTGVDPTDFRVVATGTVGTTLTQVTPVSGSIYTVTVSGISGNGTLALSLVDDGSIRDLAGKPLVPGNLATTFQSQLTFATGPPPAAVTATDVNGDGAVDLVFAHGGGANSGGVLLGNGDGTFQRLLTFAAGGGPASVAVADINRDGKIDLVFANNGSNNVSVLLGNGDGTFQRQITFASGVRPYSVALADVSGDGKLDLEVVNNGSNNVGVLLGNGDGSFQSQRTFSTGVGPNALFVADTNSDGKPDLIVADSGSNSVGVLLGNGNGTFQARI